MSGPKVVRVITREELVAAGESLLRRLDAALSEWERWCAAVGVNSSEQQGTRDRRNALERMLRADQFAEFGQAAVAEIDYLEADAGRRRERAAQIRAQERTRLLNGKELASVLLQQLEANAPERGELQRAVAGELALSELDAVLARARQKLFKPAERQLGAEQLALAARLAGGEPAQDFDAWRQKLEVSSPRLEAIFGHISELELLGQTERALELSREVSLTIAAPDNSIRDMRLDSLVISLKKAKEDAVEIEKLRRKTALLGAALGRYEEAQDAIKMLQGVAALGVKSELQVAVTAGEQKLAELHAAQVADARRRAVLDGLQQLGYQVHEQLSTATSLGGRLVVRNPAISNYGVEIAASAGMDKLQVRTVAFDSNRDASGDIPAEQRWCDDFGALKEVLKSSGADVVVERALGVGAVPIKLLSAEVQPEERRAASASRQAARK